MKTIEMTVECPACSGTGVYSGMGEGEGLAVVCYQCEGTGAYHYSYSYNEFTGRKKREDIKRVYKKGYGFRLGLGKINFSGVGEIDMDQEGVSYQEFLDGQYPLDIRTLACPMVADQGACHKIKGFTDECDRLDGGCLLGKWLKDCKYQPHKAVCWERFDRATTE